MGKYGKERLGGLCGNILNHSHLYLILNCRIAWNLPN